MCKEITELINLVQKYPAETRRILAAVNDGLRLGPAITIDGQDEEPEDEPAVPQTALLRQLRTMPGPGHDWIETTEHDRGW
jgi:hypothetical protein